MRQNNLIAITGGISSGKTLACNILKEKGYKILNSDLINKELFEDKRYIKKLKKIFPSCFINGNLDKNLLKNKIFSDKKSLDKINSLAHKKIMKKVIKKSKREKDLVFVEISAPTKFSLSYFSKIILIQINKDKQIERLKKRENIDLNLGKDIIFLQEDGIKEAKKLNPYILNNDNDIKLFRKDLLKIIEKIKSNI